MPEVDAMRVEALSLHRQREPILHGLSFRVQEGECLGIVGPNGSGKSSLLEALLGFLPLSAGSVSLFGQDLRSLSPLQRAQQMACVAQEAAGSLHFELEAFLQLAYFPWQDSLPYSVWEEDLLRLCDEFQLLDKLRRPLSRLSGGERQRVMLVQALLQKPRILLLDELTNHLDIAYQIESLAFLRQLSQSKVLVLHDLNLAARYCDRLLLLKDGAIYAEGKVDDVLTEAAIHALFGLPSEIVRENGRIHYILMGAKLR